MKSFVAILALVALAAADVSHILKDESQAAIIRQEADVDIDRYNFGFETSNGIAAQESGVLKNADREDAALSVQGSSQYTAPGGEVIQVTYTADENGYQPQGAHLPTPPPAQEIPDYILRSIEYIRTHPPVEAKRL